MSSKDMSYGHRKEKVLGMKVKYVCRLCICSVKIKVVMIQLYEPSIINPLSDVYVHKNKIMNGLTLIQGLRNTRQGERENEKNFFDKCHLSKYIYEIIIQFKVQF